MRAAELPVLLAALSFPALVAGILVLLRVRVYRRLEDVNAVFRRGWRSRHLPRLLDVLTVVAIGVFVALQAVRLPFVWGALRGLLAATEGTSPSLTSLGAGLLLGTGTACETLAFAHLLFYLSQCRVSATTPRTPPGRPAWPANPASGSLHVAILVPACDEPPEVLERSLGALVQRVQGATGGHLVLQPLLVENSRDPRCKAQGLEVARRFGVEVLDLPNRGSKAAALNDARARLPAETRYLVVLDADQALVADADLLGDALPLLEADPGLAFVQTAQAYQNCTESLVTLAAAQQQMLLYDCILESRDADQQVPCLGTNVVIRLSTLDEVGGWDEENVTEDLATSHLIHARGHRSRYLRRIYATGLAPRDLAAYFRQQTRWAWGNTGLFLRLLRGIPSRSSERAAPGLRIPYLWSSGFYVHTLVLALLGLAPTLVLILVGAARLGVVGAPLTLDLPVPAWQYASLYAVYVIVLFLPFANMALRGYPLRNLLLVQGLATSTGPVYLLGVARALRGERAVFDPVRRIAAPSVRRGPGRLLAQKLSFALFNATGALAVGLALAGPVGLLRVVPWVLAFWCLVHAVALGHGFLLTRAGTGPD